MRAGTLGIVPALLVAVLAVTAPLAVSPALSTLKVSAIPFGQPGGGIGLGGTGGGPGGDGSTGGSEGTLGSGGADRGGAGSGVRTIDLVDNLQAVLTDRSGEVMFKARRPTRPTGRWPC